jgi:hypothetical protein
VVSLLSKRYSGYQAGDASSYYNSFESHGCCV